VAQAYTFELGKCYEQTIKERALHVIANIDPDLCATVAAGLGLPAPQPSMPPSDAPTPSPALSQIGAQWPVVGRVIGIVADENSDLAAIATVTSALAADAIVPLVIGPHGGKLVSDSVVVPISRTFDTARSIEFDALLLAGAPADPRLEILLTEMFRHGKAIGAWSDAITLLDNAGIAASDGVVTGEDSGSVLEQVITLLKSHRVWSRL
jgi:catalase